MASTKGSFKKGNTASKGRPKGATLGDLSQLADEVAELIMEADRATIIKAEEHPRSVTKLQLHRSMERMARMTKGRIPTRIAISGDPSGEPIPFSYIDVRDTTK